MSRGFPGHLRRIATLAAVLAIIVALCASQQDDVTLLLQLRDSIYNWPQYKDANEILGWSTAVDVCLWTGVTCGERGRVSSVSLACNECPLKASGVLPPNLGGMDSLILLDLTGNAFEGRLPVEWAAPGQFSALNNLFLGENELSGPIPWQGTAFPSLQLLRIDQNNLEGSLPSDLVLPSLLVLRAFNNSFSGALPPNLLVTFPSINILGLQFNRLSGPLPPEWSRDDMGQEMQELYLQGNDLTGGLPPEWGIPAAFPQLQFLNLEFNPLGGTLPAEWGQPGSFPELRNLNLQATNISGELPASWASPQALRNLNAMHLSGNNVSGSLDAWDGFPSLQRLFIRPGNEALCIDQPPEELTFGICIAGDLSCNSPIQLLNCTTGELRPLPQGTVLPSEDPSSAAAAAAGDAQSAEGDGGSDFPVAAVVVPIAVAVPLAILGGFLLLAWRRRQRRHMDAEAALGTAPSGRMSHPFDTAEGQQAFTSPFSPAAFSTINAIAVAPAPGQTSGGSSSSKDYYSSSGSTNPCSRIRTNSFQGPMPPQMATMAASPATARSSPLPGSEMQMTSLPPGSSRRSFDVQPRRVSMSGSGDGGGPSESVVRQQLGGSGGVGDGSLGTGRAPTEFGIDIPFSDWEIKPEELEVMKRADGTDWVIGSGGFGVVYKALRGGVQPVAVKRLTSNTAGQPVEEMAFRREIAILKACRDSNIVAFQGAYFGQDQTLLVTEYMEGGSLAANLAAGRVNWWRRGRKVAIDVAKGLSFLHARKIVHFDLKSPNILLGRDGTAKIADVGMAAVLAKNYVTGVVGTLAWAAPEMLWGAKCNEKADIYSFGIVLWEICTRERPIRGQLRDVRVPEECPPEVRQIMLECLETRPSRRPTAVRIVERLQASPTEAPPEVAVALVRNSANTIRGSNSTVGAGEASNESRTQRSAETAGGTDGDDN